RSAGGRPSRRGRRGSGARRRMRPTRWWPRGRRQPWAQPRSRWARGWSSGGLLGVGVLPAAAVGRAGLDGGENALDLQRLLEGRGGIGALADRGHQVGDLVGEGVLVAQAVPGGPPVGGIGVLG